MSDTEREVLAEFQVFPKNSEEESHQNTLIFLELYEKYREQVGTMRITNLKKMFEEIANKMKRSTKTKISGTNCERNYKKYIDNSKLTGRGRNVFEYADAMHSILGQKNINPVLLLSSDTINTQEASEKDKENDMEIGTPNNVQENIKTHAEMIQTPERKVVTNFPENKRLKSVILREIRSDRKQYYNKRLDIEMKRLLEEKRRNDLLEKHDALLEEFLHSNN